MRTLKNSGEMSPGLGKRDYQTLPPVGRARHVIRRNGGVLGTQPDKDATFYMVMTQTVPGGHVSGNQETKGPASVFLATSFLGPGVILGGGTVPIMTKQGFSVPLLR